MSAVEVTALFPELGGHWLASWRSDPRAAALYRRHYSAEKNAKAGLRDLNFMGPGETMVLLSSDCSAVFAWQRNVGGPRLDGQAGICCTLFRNEGTILSSELIREADDLAWRRWPGERHFTYVNAGKVRRKRDPGRCFLRADWRYAGASKSGLLLLERLP